MNTSILTVVLSSALLTGQNSTPTWQTDYTQAQQQSVAQKKPLAVVFGSGANGWSKVVREPAPTNDVAKLLAEKYICVYVDTGSSAGKALAQSFSITGSVGIVLGDRTGSSQAFWHQGDMPAQSLARFLQKYADPATVVRTAETATTSRTSFYPSESEWGVSSDPSYCPSCNGGGRSRR